MAPRPRKFRMCREFNGTTFYKPRGVPLSMLEMNELDIEELEALRLCDFEELEQEEAAKKMGISRASLQRDLYSARKKVADALLHSKAIKICAKGEK